MTSTIDDDVQKSLFVNGHDLTLREVADVACGALPLRLKVDPDAISRMADSHGLKLRLIDLGLPIYGVTTGFGDSSTRQISPEKTADLQRNLVVYHLNGTGPESSREVVRATLLIRANCLARGHSGIRPALAAHLLAMLENDVLPIIPERGSVGASGDLVPLCYLASAVIGVGTVRYRGRDLPATEAYEDCGMGPFVLEAKEGLALINGTSFMSAFSVLAVEGAKEIAAVADLCTALGAQVMLGNQGHYDRFIHEQKPHPGQLACAENISRLMRGSGLSHTQGEVLTSDPMPSGTGYYRLDHPVQDRYSLRCAPGVTGVLRDLLEWSEKWVSIEINSTNDNPLFDAGENVVRSGGNFYGGHIGQSMDGLKLALANVADLLDRQLALIVDEKFNNGLPANLVRPVEPEDWQAGLHHGFKGMQIAASSLAAEALKLTMPASAFSRSTEAHNQDKVSMGTIAARDARTVLELTEQVAAIHLLALCQAVDFRGPELLSPGSRPAYDLVREHVPFAAGDRRMDADIHAVVALIRSGALRKSCAVS
ncbi:aromatic amino acid ammonia-lyase [Umezawaea sp. Da 62-37]|uniref:aromatic amino acid ammonia-lyase n=1 Tax=Umezawaea sp. Da 62-37 TaxID=3075927 RepID=UPI0028F6C5AC|nr:aromatic amino acid ammonia-lyase [Umezawaea sp. Da 62-37]WNV89592.1 aromatic amino acid ammonia-lyase [Umezawaea sp. Da 62-37]